MDSQTVKASIYRCFKADQRISMEVYADGLVSALVAADIDCHVHIPQSKLEKLHKNRWVMRYLRYKFYPAYIKETSTSDCGISHITDHGYAHLFDSLKSRVKCISAHDLIPYLTWKGVIKKDNHGNSFKVKKPRLNLHSLSYLPKYDHIITISQSTANDLVEHLGVDAGSISVIPPVISSQYELLKEAKVSAFRRRYNLDDNHKWLMVSGREYYKNHRTSLLVLKELIHNFDKPIKLIKTGLPSREFQSMVNDLGLSDYVHYLFLSDVQELPALYNAVDCLLFPSLYEGFGMPVAEALACGTPVVMSNRASLPEAGGSLALACEPFDIETLTEAVISQLSSEVKKQMLSDGPLWVRRFRQAQVAQQLGDVYHSIS